VDLKSREDKMIGGFIMDVLSLNYYRKHPGLYLLTYLLTHLLTPWGTVLLGKLSSFQLVKEFLAF